MNGFVVLGLIAHGVFAYAVGAIYPVLSLVFAVCFALGLAGAAATFARRTRRFGARLLMASSVPFVPLGLLAMYGAVVALDRWAEEDFKDGLATRRTTP